MAQCGCGHLLNMTDGYPSLVNKTKKNQTQKLPHGGPKRLRDPFSAVSNIRAASLRRPAVCLWKIPVQAHIASLQTTETGMHSNN